MSRTQRLKSFYNQSKRVWKILKKPTKDEFFLISKVSGIGILALGLVGFIISTVIKLFT